MASCQPAQSTDQLYTNRIPFVLFILIFGH
jgi:hypothetical protein